ncbi:MAG: PD-(D/E)XK nuclease-like domain-containing protein, partial [Gemmatimonadetes bacterium]|nr:PD-(D/E)XK nuclease-like domain-containing protein [Gemmatimonadota bacterium]
MKQLPSTVLTDNMETVCSAGEPDVRISVPPVTAIYDPSMSMADYHDCKALSRSGIVDLLRSPAHYYARHRAEGRKEMKSTPAMQFGIRVHMAVLEPVKFATTYQVGPDVKSKASREWKDAVADHTTVELIKPADIAKVRGIMESVFSHPAVKGGGLLDGRAEVSYFWTDDGREYRVRPDMVTHDGMVIDLKTTGDASYETYHKHAWNMGYH